MLADRDSPSATATAEAGGGRTALGPFAAGADGVADVAGVGLLDTGGAEAPTEGVGELLEPLQAVRSPARTQMDVVVIPRVAMPQLWQSFQGHFPCRTSELGGGTAEHDLVPTGHGGTLLARLRLGLGRLLGAFGQVLQEAVDFRVEFVAVQSWARFTELIETLPERGVRVLALRTDRKRDAAQRKRLLAAAGQNA